MIYALYQEYYIMPYLDVVLMYVLCSCFHLYVAYQIRYGNKMKMLYASTVLANVCHLIGQ